MSRKRILIVEDEDDIVNLVRLILEDAGYDVESAANGIEALDRVQKQTYDLVLLDLMMPGLGGWDVLRELRNNSQTKNLPVAILTARSSPVLDPQQPPVDYCDYITKPFEPEDLIHRISKILSP